MRHTKNPMGLTLFPRVDLPSCSSPLHGPWFTYRFLPSHSENEIKTITTTATTKALFSCPRRMRLDVPRQWPQRDYPPFSASRSAFDLFILYSSNSIRIERRGGREGERKRGSRISVCVCIFWEREIVSSTGRANNSADVESRRHQKELYLGLWDAQTNASTGRKTRIALSAPSMYSTHIHTQLAPIMFLTRLLFPSDLTIAFSQL